ncbi:L,D-transpeptidase family protein [Sphingomonas lutea]|uniref:L,D-transpeptidase family protein n=1 Tax=Sphingomonas lutea TaxID=1045317 RepID=A0A7G9SHM1_9SPHN|nr:L,D-transpeptidase family protein [Sphingomonas lutea]QNN67346.1 L,D-transpeptidase family protein [Sphingomonas lutea]
MKFSIPLILAAALLSGCSAITPFSAPRSVAATAPAPQPPPYRWTQGNAPKAHKDMLATFSRGGLAPGEFVWAASVPQAGETRIVIDLLTQTAYAYRGPQLVGASSISSAKTGKVTPLGFWSVLEKKKFHRSRKYDNAPMPFMQRLDEYGIALHGGANPGYPASHGCVRLPMKFAEKLYALTRVGSKVVIEG